MAKKQILVVDDEQEVCSFFRYFLQAKDCEVTIARSGAETSRIIEAHPRGFDCALIDLKLPDANGLELLSKVKAAFPACQVLIMTGYSTIKSAVTAIQLGAKDYLEKPFDDLDSLEKVIDSVLYQPLLLADQLAREAASYGIVYAPESPLAKLMNIAHKLAKKAINVLIEGETGTGKELLARYLHGNSLRAVYPFVAVNCGAIAESLLESELFGHEKGAFTGAMKTRKGFFEVAHNGTLFLDEIGEAPLSIQVKLLRVLESGEYLKVGGEQVAKANVRLISATNQSLQQEVEAKRFRQDLLYRLEGVKLTIPPLRERTCDIPLIAQTYLDKRFGPGRQIDPAAMSILQAYSWPGNVRQLLNVLQQTMAIHDCQVIRPHHLPPQISELPAEQLATIEMASISDQLLEQGCNRFAAEVVEHLSRVEELDFTQLIKRLKALESQIGRELIKQGLARYGGDRTQLSEKWNISKRTIRYYLNEK